MKKIILFSFITIAALVAPGCSKQKNATKPETFLSYQKNTTNNIGLTVEHLDKNETATLFGKHFVKKNINKSIHPLRLKVKNNSNETIFLNYSQKGTFISPKVVRKKLNRATGVKAFFSLFIPILILDWIVAYNVIKNDTEYKSHIDSFFTEHVLNKQQSIAPQEDIEKIVFVSEKTLTKPFDITFISESKTTPITINLTHN